MSPIAAPHECALPDRPREGDVETCPGCGRTWAVVIVRNPTGRRVGYGWIEHVRLPRLGEGRS